MLNLWNSVHLWRGLALGMITSLLLNVFGVHIF